MDPVNQIRLRQRRQYTRRFLRNLAVLLSLLAGLWQRVGAADEQSLEYQVKAAFLLNFAKFTEWPSSAFRSADAPLSICILGDDPFDGVLDQMIRGEAINGRKLAVLQIKRQPRPQTCQVLFMGKTQKDIRRTLADLGSGVLTVGEEESFLREGGMITFVIENRRTRFDVNPTAADSAGLKLSSKLLSVARTVKK